MKTENKKVVANEFPPSDFQAISVVIQKYIDGFLTQDTAALQEAFQEDAKLISVNDGVTSGLRATDWFSSIDARRRDGALPKPGKATLISIDQTETAAVAKVTIVFPTHTFVDYLSLLKAEQRWQIVNKIYAVIE